MKKSPKLKKIIAHFANHGYVIPDDVEFYLVTRGTDKNRIGMKVGKYIHSCEIETTDMIVLLFIDSNERVKAYSDLFSITKIN